MLGAGATWKWGTEGRQKQEEEEKKEKLGVCGGARSTGIDGTAFPIGVPKHNHRVQKII